MGASAELVTVANASRATLSGDIGLKKWLDVPPVM